MARRGWVRGAMIGGLIAVCLAGSGVGGAHGAARRQTEESINPVNEKLLSQPPAVRAAELAKIVGHWCIGTEAFEMGVAKAGAGTGNAYWSLRCADGGAWALQIDPLGEITAIDCETFRVNGAGKECFKKF